MRKTSLFLLLFVLHMTLLTAQELATHAWRGVLFDQADVLTALAKHIAALSQPAPPPRVDEHDRLIDNEYRMVDVCGQREYVSDILYAMDPTRYQEIALELRDAREAPSPESDQSEDGS